MLGDIDARKAAPGAAAAALILASLFTDSWWSGDMGVAEVGVGLRSFTICSPADCQSSPLPRTGSSFFSLTSSITFFVGLIAAALVAFDSILRPQLGADSVPRLSGHACSAVCLSAVATVISFPGLGQAGMSVGWGFWAFLVGAILGVYAGFADRFAVAMGGTYVPVVVGSGDEGPTGDAMPAGPAVRSVGARPDVRFAVSSLAVDARGVWTTSSTGAKRMLRFVDIAKVSARQLPPPPPFRGRVFVDIVPLASDGQAKPLRACDNIEITLDGQACELPAVLRRLFEQNPAIDADEKTRALGRGMGANQLPLPEDVELFDQQYLGAL